MPATLHKYLERGAGGFANLTLPSGERIFISLAASGLRVHRVLLGGLMPGRTLYSADLVRLVHLVEVLERDVEQLPALPDFAAMDAFLTAAVAALSDPTSAGRGSADGDLPASRLSVLTRAALGAADAASFVRLLERATNTP